MKGSLQYISRVTMPVLREEFLASEKFVVTTSGPVKISWLGCKFVALFLSVGGQINYPKDDSVAIDYYDLIAPVTFNEILAELGRSDQEDVYLAQVYHLLWQQGNGQTGVLFADGRTNSFFVKDRAGVLRIVCLTWRSGGWEVTAHFLDWPIPLAVEDRVFVHYYPALV